MGYLSEEAALNLSWQGYSRWVEDFDDILEAVLAKENLEALEPVWGGKSGALVRLAKPDGILKLLPPALARGQIEAHRILSGQSCPHLWRSSSQEGWLLMEHLSGKPASKEEPVSLSAATVILETIWQSAFPPTRASYRDTISSWTDTKDLPWQREVALSLCRSAPQSEEVHLHGDIGVHNLIWSGSQLLFVDPGGVTGPPEWDLGCLAAWSGARKEDTAKIAARLAELTDLSEKEIMRWALVRIACSAILGFQRNAHDQYRMCNQALRKLLPAWENKYR